VGNTDKRSGRNIASLIVLIDEAPIEIFPSRDVSAAISTFSE